ncbi:MAG TPA: adenylate/guanylate cyclase domain-containing protein [Stellaceae bacterium]|jgi:adenylate cyclase
MSVPGDNQPASGSMRTLMIDNQKVIDELNARIQRRDQEVKIIQQISSEINSTLDLEHMLGIILDSLDRVLGFKHCMILLSDNAAASLSVAALRGYENQQPGATVPVGQGPIGVAARRRRVVRMAAMAAQMGYVAAVRGEMGHEKAQVKLPGLANVQSQMAIPLVVKDRLVGVLAVESAAINAFDALDELLLSIVANQVASAIDNARLYLREQERSQLLDNTNRELSQLNETLESKVNARTAELTEALGDLERRKVQHEELLARMAPRELIPLMVEDRLQAVRLNATVMFTDLSGFTSFSAGMEPDEVFAHLNHYFAWLGDAISRYRGYVNKTMGDGTMILFGVPEPSLSHATDAVLAALTLQSDVGTTISLNMRIGISSGVITAGMLGPRNKSMYDVLGETVNVAQRMESSAPLGGIVVTAATADLVRPYFLLETLPEQEIKGLSKMTNFRVVGLRKLTDDPRRVDPSGRFAAMATPLQQEIEAFKAQHFDSVNFVSIQARDGAFYHNETVAILALALLRELRGHPQLGTAASQLDEARLLRFALLHDIGKRTLDTARLNRRGLTAEERAALRTDLERATAETLDRLELGELASALPPFYRFEAQELTGEIDMLTEIVGVADIYDALTAPKFYKGTPWSIRGALEDMMRMPFAINRPRPILAAFAELMRPAAATLTSGRSAKPVLD